MLFKRAQSRFAEPAYRGAEPAAERGENECPGRARTASTMVGIGLGFGAGVLLGAALVKWSRSHGRDASTAERVGRQVLEVVSGALPKSVSRHIPT